LSSSFAFLDDVFYPIKQDIGELASSSSISIGISRFEDGIYAGEA